MATHLQDQRRKIRFKLQSCLHVVHVPNHAKHPEGIFILRGNVQGDWNLVPNHVVRISREQPRGCFPGVVASKDHQVIAGGKTAEVRELWGQILSLSKNGLPFLIHLCVDDDRVEALVHTGRLLERRHQHLNVFFIDDPGGPCRVGRRQLASPTRKFAQVMLSFPEVYLFAFGVDACE